MKEKHKDYGPYEAFIKRILDCAAAGGALLILSPVFAVIGILVRTRLGAPVLFVQERPGKDEKIFKLYKFRSMSDARDKNGTLLPDTKRLTKFGRVLRSTSLDELPELFNILKGDMSLIGPRPLAVQYLPYYTEEERHRHDVRPGLSGLAQIHGRNDLPWEERFQYDLQYINHITFLGDLAIFLGTIGKVLKKDHISIRGEGTVIDFDVYRIGQQRKKDEDKN